MPTSEVSLTFIVAGVAAIALVIGVLLYRYSQRSSREQFEGEGERSGGGAASSATLPPTQLAPVILEQLKQLPGSSQQRQRVARTVTDIVQRAMDDHVGTVKRDLTHHYGRQLEETKRTASALQRKYQETLQEKKQTSAVLESIAEGLVVINNKGDVVMMNSAAERLLSVRQKDRIGRPLQEGLGDEQLLSLVQGNRNDGAQEIVLDAKQESTKRVLRASHAMITDENGKTVGMLAMLSDVTKQREIEQLKSDFVSTVSHELRTPLVAMRHALSILTDQVAGPLNGEQQNFAGIIQRNLDRLNTLINDLLDLSKLEARKMALRPETASISAIVAQVAESLEPWAGTKAISLVRRVPEGLPNVVCDPNRMTQVLTNLVGNAIKFTPNQGRVTIEVKLIPEERMLEVSVADTGIGITPEDLPKLFSKFQQVGGERAGSDMSGTGLGLVIAKEIVELHQGRIWAESDGKQGSRFLFAIPLNPAFPTAS
ncbi:MAG: PAS domain-containing protein [Candidatus Omnitrophica bacterium]|nr:PAS domain-containing protein [Candidatus Omnitrophota bacterium]